MKWGRTYPPFLPFPAFSIWRGSGKAGLKCQGLSITIIQSPCFHGRRQTPEWGVMMLCETGSPEKVKKGSWNYPNLVSAVEWMSEQQSGTLEDLGLDPGSSTICLSCSYLKVCSAVSDTSPYLILTKYHHFPCESYMSQDAYFSYSLKCSRFSVNVWKKEALKIRELYH